MLTSAHGPSKLQWRSKRCCFRLSINLAKAIDAMNTPRGRVPSLLRAAIFSFTAMVGGQVVYRLLPTVASLPLGDDIEHASMPSEDAEWAIVVSEDQHNLGNRQLLFQRKSLHDE